MNKALVIVFVKNFVHGQVKTRLAKTIGNQSALNVYKELVKITLKSVEELNVDKRIYFSEEIDNSQGQGFKKTVQKGIDLGERMKNAFSDGFTDGYDSIILIGSDLPDINSSIIQEGLQKLKNTEVVLGPAVDGGYYLLGLQNIHDELFDDKPWSQSNLLNETKRELDKKKITYSLLTPLNDIDTYEDLIASDFFQSNEILHSIKINK